MSRRRNADGGYCCGMVGGHYIPGCMGGAALGRHGCTCKPLKRIPPARKILWRLERETARMHADVLRLCKLMEKREVKPRKKKTPQTKSAKTVGIGGSHFEPEQKGRS